MHIGQWTGWNCTNRTHGWIECKQFSGKLNWNIPAHDRKHCAVPVKHGTNTIIKASTAAASEAETTGGITLHCNYKRYWTEVALLVGVGIALASTSLYCEICFVWKRVEIPSNHRRCHRRITEVNTDLIDKRCFVVQLCLVYRKIQIKGIMKQLEMASKVPKKTNTLIDWMKTNSMLALLKNSFPPLQQFLWFLFSFRWFFSLSCYFLK